ncbi:wall-associated receptor kinase-like 16 [Canna indica]|uniref:Wall-associated receptor kinase-like 16 n=1 Tax=Canna indica TaxID=4628 RepID=A0AAQ3L1W1_9LILI|nr:wall-associated receptor kinase-like 16 [Canna indica]
MEAPVVMLFQLAMTPLWLTAAALLPAETLPGCRPSCGQVKIPYPFGIGRNCSIQESFTLDCKRADDGTEKPFIFQAEVLEIRLPVGQIRLLNQISSQCYDPRNNSIQHIDRQLDLPSPYTFSESQNKFTVVGCQTLAYMGSINNSNPDATDYQIGCVSMCRDEDSLSDGSCAGIGCCQTAIPTGGTGGAGLWYYQVWFDDDFNTSGIYNLSRCSYAVVVEVGSFRFQTSYITTDDFMANNSGQLPVVVDYGIGEVPCEEAKLNVSSYACKSENSVCVDSTTGHGYLCSCTEGYHGSPYIEDGCQDIDECAEEHQNPCKGKCQNKLGGYVCYCPKGTRGDPYNGICYQDQELSLAVKLAIGLCSSLAFLFLCSMCIYMIHQRKNFMKLKEQYFRDHGGWQLLEEIKGKQGLAFKIFKIEELEKATDNFDKSRVLGQGGHGTVYKGILEDKRVVAIKKAKFIDESQKNEYGKEMLILSQINHKNIVKLLGCCLEVEVPILVYEFVSNGTLFHLLHERKSIHPFTLGSRLNIAVESADALAYLHLTASPPIIHGDVKSSNILLDESYIAKVSDFGASKLVPKDENQLATLVQGTWGYIDPEYFQTSRLTAKSDVYSFGVLLLELLTGKKALCFQGSEGERSLASNFILAMKENRVSEVVDSQIKDETDTEFIQEISKLAEECLNVSGEKRPTMKEVAFELDKLRKLIKQHPWVPLNHEEIEILLGEPSNDYGTGTTTHYKLETSELSIVSGR